MHENLNSHARNPSQVSGIKRRETASKLAEHKKMKKEKARKKKKRKTGMNYS